MRSVHFGEIVENNYKNCQRRVMKAASLLKVPLKKSNKK